MKPGTPAITIINACYNTGRYVIETLHAINKQTFRDFEVIITDDASTDDSIALIDAWIEQHPGLPVQFIKNKKNQGIVPVVNHALGLAKGTYFTLIGDDTWYPGYLERLYDILEAAPADVVMVYADASIVEYATKEVIGTLNPFEQIKNADFEHKDELLIPRLDAVYEFRNDLLKEYLLFQNPVIAFTCLMKTAYIKDAGGYDTAYSFEDYPMWMKLVRRYKIWYLDEVLADYIRHGDSFTIKRKHLVSKESLLLCLDNRDFATTPVTIDKLSRRLFDLWYGLYAAWITDKETYNEEKKAITRRLLLKSGGFRKQFARLILRKLLRLFG